MQEDVLGIDERDNGVQAKLLLHFWVGEERLGHRGGISEAGGLDENGIEPILALHQPTENTEEIAAYGAANAAVIHFENFLVRLNDQLVVDAHFTELIFNHRNFFAVLLRKNTIEQSGFSGAEEASENRDGNA